MPRLILILILAACANPRDGHPKPRVPEWAEVPAGTRFDLMTGLPRTVRDRGTGIVLDLRRPGDWYDGEEWRSRRSPGRRSDTVTETVITEVSTLVEVQRAFYVGRALVTNAQWQAVMGRPAGGLDTATGMMRADVDEFLKRTSMRLLTELEGAVVTPGSIAEYRQEHRALSDATKPRSYGSMSVRTMVVGFRVARDP